jgi:osomolarity two-component system sensor histidine kinase SLN1
MDFFLAKPIRRPALKHVLKTYCPPIPEEEGEITTPPAPESSSKASYKRPWAPSNGKGGVNSTAAPSTNMANTQNLEESPAVSPLTNSENTKPEKT